MAQELIFNGEQAFVVRQKINNNFSEVYSYSTTLSSIAGSSKANSLSTNKLLGRYSAATGPCEEISIGSGLDITSGTLTYRVSKTLAVFTAKDGVLLSTSPATITTRGSHSVIAFDQGTQEVADFSTIIPEYTDITNGMLINIKWVARAGLGTVGWEVALERIANGTNIGVDNFGTSQFAPPKVVPVSIGDIESSFVTFTFAQIPAGLTDGDVMRVRIKRDVANDTLAADAEIISVEIRVL